MHFVQSVVRVSTLTVFAAGVAASMLHAQSAEAAAAVHTMIAREADAAQHKTTYSFVSFERSDRTGGHLWKEKVVETHQGRVRFLLEEDGKPLSGERTAGERGRLAQDVADPQAFAARESAQKDEEAHARQLLDLLGKGFVLDGAVGGDGDWHIHFEPDPNYSPNGVEEKVLHGMSGTLLIDARQMRMRHIEGRLAHDISVYGFLATVHAGSNFSSTKAPFDGTWRTVSVVNDIRGKAVLFKTIAKNQTVERSGFHRVPESLTIAQAVALVEQ